METSEVKELNDATKVDAACIVKDSTPGISNYSPEKVEAELYDQDEEETSTDARIFGIGKKSSKNDAVATRNVEIIVNPAPRVPQTRPAPPPPRFEFEETEYFYKMNHPNRGIALVLNYETFSPDRYDQASTRRGSSVDAANLVNTFGHLGFDVRRYDNLTTVETLHVLREVALADHSHNDCLAVAVMSHGDQVPGGETIFYTYDKTLRITDDLVARFSGSRCESLRGKPKLFFVQACQGSKTDQGVFYQESNGNGHTNGNGNGHGNGISAPKTVHIPDEADVLIAYSTPPGYYSWRNESLGSWFINELCSGLGKWAHEIEITRLLTRVCFNVSRAYASCSSDPRMSNKKQCPTFVSRLTKELQFPLLPQSIENPQEC